ncbi:MAG: SCO1/SenC [Verrucomicrobiales bacterium]|nr:SCO1/SenC [Verrucomicrobiales bacterium]
MTMTTPLYLFLLVLMSSFACLAEQPKATPPPCCLKPRGTPTNSSSLSDSSLYQVESKWTNDNATPITLGTLSGKPQIITMFFASCEYACPLLVHDMQQIEKALPPELRSKVNFTLVSFDTERDTPKVLNTYRTTHHLGTNWTLLRGNSDDVLELAALLGVKFKKDARGQFAHSNVITLLNGKGEIISQQIGLNRDPASTVVAVQKLLKGSAD